MSMYNKKKKLTIVFKTDQFTHSLVVNRNLFLSPVSKEGGSRLDGSAHLYNSVPVVSA